MTTEYDDDPPPMSIEEGVVLEQYVLAERAIDAALHSVDPATAVLGAIAFHLRTVLIPRGECDTITECLQDIRDMAEDPDGYKRDR